MSLAQIFVPKTRPTSEETPIASAPQNATLSAPRHMEAPPTRAAIAPRTARSSSAAPVTLTLNHDRGEKAATNTGSSAPAENAMAEEIAGCGA